MQLSQNAKTLFVLITTVGAAAVSASDVLSTYRGVTGNWGVNANWSNNPALGGFPNNGNGGVATYDAVINSGTVSLDQNIAIQKLTFTGGTIASNFNLTANDLFNWTGGIIDDAGVTIAN